VGEGLLEAADLRTIPLLNIKDSLLFPCSLFLAQYDTAPFCHGKQQVVQKETNTMNATIDVAIAAVLVTAIVHGCLSSFFIPKK
jgi:hypothetical protein